MSSLQLPKFKVGDVLPVGSLFLPVDDVNHDSILSLDQFHYYTDAGDEVPILTMRRGVINVYDNQWVIGFGRINEGDPRITGVSFSNQISSGELHISPSYATPTNIPGISVVNCWERKNMSYSYIGLLDLTGVRPSLKLIQFINCYSEPHIERVPDSYGPSDNWPIRDELLKHPGYVGIHTVQGVMFLNPDTLELSPIYNPVIHAIVSDESLTDNYQSCSDMQRITTQIVEACKTAAMNAVSESERGAVAAALDALL